MRYRNAMITLLMTVMAVALGSCGRSGTPRVSAPDTVYFNGKVITVDGDFSIHQAFAVQGDRFAAVGSDEEITGMAGPDTVRVDLDGATVIPGLSDNHDHLFNAGKYLNRGVDMIGVDDFDEMRRRLQSAVANSAPGEVVFTTIGWTVNPSPSRAQLDEISAEVPIVLIRNRRGSGQVNGAALSSLGISRDNPTFMGANVPVDAAGEPTGSAPAYPYGVYFLDALLPAVTAEYEDELLASGMRQRNSLGITSIRDLALWPAAVDAYRRNRAAGRLTVRVGMGLEFPDQENTLAHLAELPSTDRMDPWLVFDSVAEEPWTPGTLPLEEYVDFLRGLDELGWRPAPHTNSDVNRGISADDAANLTLSAYETIDARSSIYEKRWYVEHVPLATPAQMERMAALGIVVSAQTVGYAEVPHVDLPAARLEHVNPIRGFLDHGIPVIGGSDYNGPNPMQREPNNPMTAIGFYVTRKSMEGEVATPAEKISREDALRIFTTYPAWAAFQDDLRGSIAAGKLADFVILDQDLLTVGEDSIGATRALATFVGGNKVFAAPGTGY